MKKSYRRGQTGAAVLATIILFTQGLFAYTPESNLWEQRRRASRREGALQLAKGFPALAPQGTDIFSPFSSQTKPAALPPSIIRSTPETELNDLAPLLSGLSPAHGSIRKISLPESRQGPRPVVIHLQDVHRNAEAQRNLREAVRGLIESGRVDTIALEGADEDIDLQPFVDFQHRKAVSLAADYLLRENTISGPIHAALTARGRLPRILGMEDPIRYQANIRAYQESAPKIAGMRRKMKAQAAAIEVEKSTLYSPALRAFDQQVESYRAGTSTLGSYVETLLSQTDSRLVPESLVHFQKALRLERALDLKQAEADRRKLIDTLTAKLNTKETEVLLIQTLAYRSGQRRYADFFADLKVICQAKNVPLANFPALEDYVRYVLLSDRIAPEQLLVDLAELEKLTYARLANSPMEKLVIARSREIFLKEKLVDFALTPSEWEEYKGRGLAEANPALKSFESFYKEAQARDAAMARNLLKALADKEGPRPAIAILVTGGFHAEGMARRLTSQGATVVSYVPKIETRDADQGSDYLSVFSQEKTPLEKLFAGEKLFLAEPPMTKPTRRWVAPAAVVLMAGILGLLAGVDQINSAFQSLGGAGAIASITLGTASASARIWTPPSMLTVAVNGDANGMKNAAVAPNLAPWSGLFLKFKIRWTRDSKSFSRYWKAVAHNFQQVLREEINGTVANSPPFLKTFHGRLPMIILGILWPVAAALPISGAVATVGVGFVTAVIMGQILFVKSHKNLNRRQFLVRLVGTGLINVTAFFTASLADSFTAGLTSGIVGAVFVHLGWNGVNDFLLQRKWIVQTYRLTQKPNAFNIVSQLCEELESRENDPGYDEETLFIVIQRLAQTGLERGKSAEDISAKIRGLISESSTYLQFMNLVRLQLGSPDRCWTTDLPAPSSDTTGSEPKPTPSATRLSSRHQSLPGGPRYRWPKPENPEVRQPNDDPTSEPIPTPARSPLTANVIPEAPADTLSLRQYFDEMGLVGAYGAYRDRIFEIFAHVIESTPENEGVKVVGGLHFYRLKDSIFTREFTWGLRRSDFPELTNKFSVLSPMDYETEETFNGPGFGRAYPKGFIVWGRFKIEPKTAFHYIASLFPEEIKRGISSPQETTISCGGVLIRFFPRLSSTARVHMVHKKDHALMTRFLEALFADIPPVLENEIIVERRFMPPIAYYELIRLHGHPTLKSPPAAISRGVSYARRLGPGGLVWAYEKPEIIEQPAPKDLTEGPPLRQPTPPSFRFLTFQPPHRSNRILEVIRSLGVQTDIQLLARCEEESFFGALAREEGVGEDSLTALREWVANKSAVRWTLAGGEKRRMTPIKDLPLTARSRKLLGTIPGNAMGVENRYKSISDQRWKQISANLATRLHIGLNGDQRITEIQTFVNTLAISTFPIRKRVMDFCESNQTHQDIQRLLDGIEMDIRTGNERTPFTHRIPETEIPDLAKGWAEFLLRETFPLDPEWNVQSAIRVVPNPTELVEHLARNDQLDDFREFLWKALHDHHWNFDAVADRVGLSEFMLLKTLPLVLEGNFPNDEQLLDFFEAHDWDWSLAHDLWPKSIDSERPTGQRWTREQLINYVISRPYLSAGLARHIQASHPDISRARVLVAQDFGISVPQLTNVLAGPRGPRDPASPDGSERAPKKAPAPPGPTPAEAAAEALQVLEADMGEESVEYLASRHGLDVRNILWGIAAEKLEGRYDPTKLGQAIDLTIVQLLDRRVEKEVGEALLRPLPTEPSMETPADLTDDRIDQAGIERLAETLKKHIPAGNESPALTSSAVDFIRKLEESYFFREHYRNADDPRAWTSLLSKVDETFRAADNPLLQQALQGLREDIDRAIAVDQTLHQAGLSANTQPHLHQLMAIRQMAEMRKGILADEMGLGKTLQTLCAFLLSGESTLVVAAPKAALARWLDDIAKHLDTPLEIDVLADVPVPEGLRATQITGASARAEALYGPRAPLEGKRRIVLVNFEAIPFLELHRRGRVPTAGFLALDEAHLIKKESNKTTKALYGDRQGNGAWRAPHIILLTGTPIENKVSDFFGHLQFLARGDPESEEIIRSVRTEEDWTANLLNLSRLHTLLSRWMIRRLKADVLSGLPEKTYVAFRLDPLRGSMGGPDGEIRLGGDYLAQMELCDMALHRPGNLKRLLNDNASPADWKDAEEAPGSSGGQLIRMQQAAMSPAIFGHPGDSIRFDAVDHLLQTELKGKPVVIFSSYVQALRALATHLASQDHPITDIGWITGDTAPEERERARTRFQAGELPILFATYGAGGVSIELTTAEAILRLDTPWKASTLHQAIDRAHRIDPVRNRQGKTLRIYQMILDVPVSIDAIKEMVVHRKELLAHMIANGYLSPEIIAAFHSSDGIVTRTLREGGQSSLAPDTPEVRLARKLHAILDEIRATTDPAELKALWADASDVYRLFVEHKASFFANMANLDYLSQARNRLRLSAGHSGPMKVLDCGSANSTLHRAALRLKPRLEERGFPTLDIFDYDANSHMLAAGVYRQGRQIQGTFESLGKTMATHAGSFDLINLSYAFRYASHPAQFVRDIHGLMRDGGVLTLLLPDTNRLPDAFLRGLEAAGFEVVNDGTEPLITSLSDEDYKRLLAEYGEVYAEDLKETVRGRFTYLVAKKGQPTGVEINDDDFRLARRSISFTPAKAQSMASQPGRFAFVPAFVAAEGFLEGYEAPPFDAAAVPFRDTIPFDLAIVRKQVSLITRTSQVFQNQGGSRVSDRKAFAKAVSDIEKAAGKIETQMASAGTLSLEDTDLILALFSTLRNNANATSALGTRIDDWIAALRRHRAQPATALSPPSSTDSQTRATSLWLTKAAEVLGAWFIGENGAERWGRHYRDHAPYYEGGLGLLGLAANLFMQDPVVGLVSGLLFLASHFTFDLFELKTPVQVGLGKTVVMALLYGILIALTPGWGTLAAWGLTVALHVRFDMKQRIPQEYTVTRQNNFLDITSDFEETLTEHYSAQTINLQGIVAGSLRKEGKSEEAEAFLTRFEEARRMYLEAEKRGSPTAQDFEDYYSVFKGLLRREHFQEWAARMNTRQPYFDALAELSKVSGLPIRLTFVVRGIAPQFRALLERPEVVEQIRDAGVDPSSISVVGNELVFDENRTYTGQIRPPLVVDKKEHVPMDRIYIGDNRDKRYGFPFFINLEDPARSPAAKDVYARWSQSQGPQSPGVKPWVRWLFFLVPLIVGAVGFWAMGYLPAADPASFLLFVFPGMVYDAAHPYGRYPDKRSIWFLNPNAIKNDLIEPSARIIVVNKNGQILFLRTPKGDGAFWELPGGGLKPGETIQEAGLRETYEETGIRINRNDFHLIGRNSQKQFHFAYRIEKPNQGRSRTRGVKVFVSEVEDPTIHLQREEHSACRWAHLEEALANQSQFTPPTVLALHLYQKSLSSNGKTPLLLAPASSHGESLLRNGQGIDMAVTLEKESNSRFNPERFLRDLRSRATLKIKKNWLPIKRILKSSKLKPRPVDSHRGRATSLWMTKLFESAGYAIAGDDGRRTAGLFYRNHAALFEWSLGLLGLALNLYLQEPIVGLALGALFFASHFTFGLFTLVTPVNVGKKEMAGMALIYATLIAFSPAPTVQGIFDLSLDSAVAFLRTIAAWGLAFLLHSHLDRREPGPLLNAEPQNRLFLAMERAALLSAIILSLPVMAPLFAYLPTYLFIISTAAGGLPFIFRQLYLFIKHGEKTLRPIEFATTFRAIIPKTLLPFLQPHILVAPSEAQGSYWLRYDYLAAREILFNEPVGEDQWTLLEEQTVFRANANPMERQTSAIFFFQYIIRTSATPLSHKLYAMRRLKKIHGEFPDQPSILNSVNCLFFLQKEMEKEGRKQEALEVNAVLNQLRKFPGAQKPLNQDNESGQEEMDRLLAEITEFMRTVPSRVAIQDFFNKQVARMSFLKQVAYCNFVNKRIMINHQHFIIFNHLYERQRPFLVYELLRTYEIQVENNAIPVREIRSDLPWGTAFFQTRGCFDSTTLEIYINMDRHFPTVENAFPFYPYWRFFIPSPFRIFFDVQQIQRVGFQASPPFESAFFDAVLLHEAFHAKRFLSGHRMAGSGDARNRIIEECLAELHSGIPFPIHILARIAYRSDIGNGWTDFPIGASKYKRFLLGLLMFRAGTMSYYSQLLYDIAGLDLRHPLSRALTTLIRLVNAGDTQTLVRNMERAFAKYSQESADRMRSFPAVLSALSPTEAVRNRSYGDAGISLNGRESAQTLIDRLGTLPEALETLSPALDGGLTEQVLGKGASTDDLLETTLRGIKEESFRTAFLAQIADAIKGNKLNPLQIHLLGLLLTAADGETVAHVHLLGNAPEELDRIETLAGLTSAEGTNALTHFRMALVVTPTHQRLYSNRLEVLQNRGVFIHTQEATEWRLEDLQALEQSMEGWLDETTGLVATRGAGVSMDSKAVKGLPPTSRLKTAFKETVGLGETILRYLQILQAISSNA